jgi:recombination protein RecR
MRQFAKPLARLIEELERLPGVGPKTAQRLAFHLLRQPPEEVRGLAEAMVAARETVRPCAECFNLTDGERCAICEDARRDRGQICVVAQARDVAAMEATGEYDGLYHVLGGLISPMEGIGPEELSIGALLERLKQGGVREVIIATNPVVEGDATAMYLARLIKPLGIKVTRIALGLPVGGDLDYADQVTIARALAGRTEL